jgi:ribosomal protein S18 acetylase RimI-like enzyme
MNEKIKLCNNLKNVDEIMNIIKESIKVMEKNDIYQWDEIYPNKEVIIDDIKNKTLFKIIKKIEINKNVKNEEINLNKKKEIMGIVVLNEEQDNEYKKINWKYNEGKSLVIHRLVVNPKYQGIGIAKKLVWFSENHAKKNNYSNIRFDAFIKNKIDIYLVFKHINKYLVVNFFVWKKKFNFDVLKKV